MDVKELIESFNAELTCSICQRYLTDPVTVACGHCFCKGCLNQDEESFTCPRCLSVLRCRSDLKITRSLQKLSLTAQLLRPHLLRTLLDPTPCEPCEEKEKLPCEEDDGSLSASCPSAPEHKDHQDLPLEGAAEKCQGKFH